MGYTYAYDLRAGEPAPVTAETWIPSVGDAVFLLGDEPEPMRVRSLHIDPSDVEACVVDVAKTMSSLVWRQEPLSLLFPTARAALERELAATRLELESADREVHRLCEQLDTLAAKIAALPPHEAHEKETDR